MNSQNEVKQELFVLRNNQISSSNRSTEKKGVIGTEHKKNYDEKQTKSYSSVVSASKAKDTYVKENDWLRPINGFWTPHPHPHPPEKCAKLKYV